MQHIRVYMYNGLSPYLQVRYKFDSPDKNEINGSAIVNRVIGKNAHRRHREFKYFFSCCNPEGPSPPRKERPDCKCYAFFCHTIHISQGAIYTGKYLNCNKQIIVCQGPHPDILRINYKKEGDGFQCDCIGADGYTYRFFSQPCCLKKIH